MAFKICEIEPNYLRTFELNHELRVRGFENADRVEIDVKRKALRRKLREEAAQPEVATVTPDFVFATEKNEIDNTISEVRELIVEYDGQRQDVSKRILTRITHALSRLNRFPPDQLTTNAEVRAYRNVQITTLYALDEDRFDKVERYRRRNQRVLVAANERTQTEGVCKNAPVHKWNICFDGESTTGSVNAFIQRVEEVRISRHTTKEQLFASAAELFRDSALVWYRSVCNSVDSWDGLITALRRDFLPPDYDDELWSEIISRTQGPDERISLYIAVMRNLFGRLSKVPAEDKQVRIIRRNLLPKLQSQLATSSINTIEELGSIGRTVEGHLSAQARYKPPPRRSIALLEPDLGYRDLTASMARVHAESGSRGDSSPSFPKAPSSKGTQRQQQGGCFYCHDPNHFKRECPVLQQKREERKQVEQRAGTTSRSNISGAAEAKN